ncbi:MAG: chloride channel protein [Candidatus Marinimicrobia bacterium]|nr:chloride channel protein [Candidatus Neomarinimicrobiota bacterium]
MSAKVKSLTKRISSFFFSLRMQIANNPLNEYIRLLFFAFLIGVLAGLVTLAFYKLIHLISYFLYDYLPARYYNLPKWTMALFPAVGGLIVGLMIKLWPRQPRQRGVVEVIKASFIGRGVIRVTTIIFNFIATAIFLGTGGSLGPEAPVAFLGAGSGSLIGQAFRVSENQRRVFLAAGTAGAIAAVFNAPIGGVFFAIEIVLFNNFQTLTFSALIISAITADYISRVFLGDQLLLTLPKVEMALSLNILYFAVLGIITGLFSLAFIRFSGKMHNFFDAQKGRFAPLLRLTGLMLILGIVGLFFPQIIGIGYDAIQEIANNNYTWQILAIVFVLKFLFSGLLSAAGGFGGLFAPSLLMGAALGAFLAKGGNQVLGLSLDVAGFAIAGMGGMLAAVNSIPVTALLIIVEITGNYHLVLPLMLTVIMSYIIVHYVLKETVYSIELRQRGIQLFDGKELNVLKNVKIDQIMSYEFHKVYSTMDVKTLVKVIAEGAANIYWVENEQHKIIGFISWSDLKPLITDYQNLNTLVLVSDVMNPNVVSVKTDDTLDYVMKLFGRYNVDELPVTDPATGMLIGTVNRNRVIQLYNQEIFKRETAGDLATHIRYLDQTRFVEIDEDFSILEMSAPESMVNSTLKALDLRNRYHAQIILIKRLDNKGRRIVITPRADTIILPNDILILAGPTKKLYELKERYYL